MFVTIQGRQQYLWRAVDEDGDVLDILVQPATESARRGALLSQVTEDPTARAATPDYRQAA